MVTRTKLKAGVLVWLGLEVAALALAISFLGWPATIALGVLTSVAGFYVLRQAGRDSLKMMKRAMAGATGAEFDLQSAGALKIVSGVLLVFPGLLSDMFGLILLAPNLRAAIVRRFSPAVGGAPPGVVDLNPTEWRAGREQEAGAPCEPSAGMLPGGPNSASSRRRDDE